MAATAREKASAPAPAVKESSRSDRGQAGGDKANVSTAQPQRTVRPPATAKRDQRPERRRAQTKCNECIRRETENRTERARRGRKEHERGAETAQKKGHARTGRTSAAVRTTVADVVHPRGATRQSAACDEKGENIGEKSNKSSKPRISRAG